MHEQIAILLELRQLDDRLHELRSRVTAHQADLQRRRLEGDLVRDALAQEQARLESAGRKRREAELEAKSCLDRKKRSEAQTGAVKTNVEYAALQREIHALEAKAREWEETAIEAMEQEDATRRAGERLRSDLAEKDRITAEESARLAAEAVDAQSREAELEARRTTLIASLEAPARHKYERLRSVKGETAIVAVVSGSCGGCHYNLPPQKVNEVRRNEQMILCEGCGRILVWVDG